MINTEFQKLTRSIYEKLGDEYFLTSLRAILRAGVVDIPSLISKLRDIRNNLGNPETARNKVTEIKAASQFCSVPTLSGISFGENPDIKIKVGFETFSLEAKRFRFRPKDATDSVALADYVGILVPYGTPQEVQLQIEDVLLKKGQNYTGKEPFFIYLWSDSPHQVEDSEIKCAARAMKGKIGGKLLGVFYKWAAYERNVLLLESGPFADEIEKLLKSKFLVVR